MSTKTKVFISWSGERSKALAAAIHWWLPKVLQSVDPYFTPEDIEKGKGWASDIIGELEASKIGILCVTPENMHKPWLLFEAGALSKGQAGTRVCTVLFDLDSSELTGPLTLPQDTKFSKEDVKRLVNTINRLGEDSLPETDLDEIYEMWWQTLEDKVQEALANAPSETPKPQRDQREMIEEILDLTRQNARRDSRASAMNLDAVATSIYRMQTILKCAMRNGVATPDDFDTMRESLSDLIRATGLFDRIAVEIGEDWTAAAQRHHSSMSSSSGSTRDCNPSSSSGSSRIASVSESSSGSMKSTSPSAGPIAPSESDSDS